MSNRAKRWTSEHHGDGIRFHCPGCNEWHSVKTNSLDHPSWSWNGSLELPTLQPSILVTYNGPDAGQTDAEGFTAPPAVCHSFVTDGKIAYCADSTHHLSGQTVDLPDWDDE